MNVEYRNLHPNGPLPTLKVDGPFAAVLVIEAAVVPEWQNRASRWLVDSGCLYMMAWGQDCSSWDHSVDDANLSAFDYGEIPDEAWVVTTWHNEEPLDEVFWFASHCAHHPTGIEIPTTLILDIGSHDRSDAIITQFELAQATPY